MNEYTKSKQNIKKARRLRVTYFSNVKFEKQYLGSNREKSNIAIAILKKFRKFIIHQKLLRILGVPLLFSSKESCQKIGILF